MKSSPLKGKGWLKAYWFYILAIDKGIESIFEHTATIEWEGFFVLYHSQGCDNVNSSCVAETVKLYHP